MILKVLLELTLLRAVKLQINMYYSSQMVQQLLKVVLYLLNILLM
nr:MAG TPA: hypothetical protein [Caudoviricetes sp.]